MAPSKNQIAATMTRDQASQVGVIDVNQAVKHISANSRKTFGFTRKQLPPNLPTEPFMYIYSISEYGEMVELGPGFPKYTVNPCPKGKDYGEPCVIPVLHFMEEAKVDVTEHTPFTSQQIANAILRIGPGMGEGGSRRRLGWFESASNPPLDEEVKRAIEIYTGECKRLLAEGNRHFAANKLNEINETHRRAAEYLKQKVDWDRPMQKMQDCPGCMEPVRMGVIWHATPHGCGYIFDKEQYEYRFAKRAQ